jgi:hypothetical protein
VERKYPIHAGSHFYEADHRMGAGCLPHWFLELENNQLEMVTVQVRKRTSFDATHMAESTLDYFVDLCHHHFYGLASQTIEHQK